MTRTALKLVPAHASGSIRAKRSKRGPRLLPHVDDRAFLAAALEIVETPPSPIKVGMMVSICLLATLGLAWSYFGKLEIHAVARGKIEPSGHAKVVQPLEPGIVAQIHVADGETVHAGDALIVLDRREVKAELVEASAQATAAEAEAIRRAAEIQAVRDGALKAPTLPAWPASIPAPTRRREEAVLRSDLAELTATLDNLAAQEAEKKATVDQLAMSIDAEKQLMQREAERVQLRQTLASDGNGSKLNLIDAQQNLLETRAQLVSDIGKQREAETAVSTLDTERERNLKAFLADDERKMADASRQSDDKQAERDRAQVKLDRLTLRAPVDGVVQGLSVTNPGQVVTTSQEVLRIVPLGAPLEITAYISNNDAGFVRPGQTAVIKLDAFPFTRFGTIDAEVIDVAADAIPRSAAQQAQADATHAPDTGSTVASAPQTEPVSDLVFKARLCPLEQGLKVNGHMMRLRPGMTLEVEVKTGERRVIDYLIAPFKEISSDAAVER